MRTRAAELSACWAILLLAGCMGEPEVAGGRQNLGVCPDGVRPGMPCDAAGDIACETEGLLCWCATGADGTQGVIECQEHEPSAVPVCSAEGILACYEGGNMERCRFEDGRICQCVGGDATTDGETRVVCEVPPPPVPEECTVEHIDACVAGERTECRYPSGRTCACYPTERGAELFCVEDPSVPPTACDEDALQRCLAGEAVQCAYADGRICGCYLADDGTVGFRCEGEPPPDPNECTDEDYQRCAAGEAVQCVSGGQICECSGASTEPGSTGGIVCRDPNPIPACTDLDYERCRAGEPVECAFADGRICRCSPDTTDPTGSEGGFYCEPPPPPPGSEYCTDEHIAMCERGIEVRCINAEGSLCSCAPLGAPTGGLLYCEPPQTDPPQCTEEHYRACLDATAGSDVVCRDSSGTLCSCASGVLVCTQPPTPERCTDAHYEACRAGQYVECVSDSGVLCSCSPDSAGTEGGLICGG